MRRYVRRSEIGVPGVIDHSPGSHFAQGFRQQPELIRNALERRREHFEVLLCR
jgi:hypothetical protein